MIRIPFFKEALTGKELTYVTQALENPPSTGDGAMVKACEDQLKLLTGASRAYLMPSGTAGLEMSALLAGIRSGDEVIMPSFTFSSTANAFVLRGATPVFVDVREDTLNIDENLIRKCITPRTRAIVPVHYAGVGASMAAIMQIANEYDLCVIEDAAQGIGASIDGAHLGTIGPIGILSFHGTKNVSAGEGGALLLRDDEFLHRAEILREKGTNRSRFLRGEVDKYTWEDVGSSFLLGNISAAVLLAQIQAVAETNRKRILLWERYAEALGPLQSDGHIGLARPPAECRHNAHLFYVIFNTQEDRIAAQEFLADRGIGSARHYVALHTAPAGKRFGLTPFEMPMTDTLSNCLLRLPLYPGLEPSEQDQVISAIFDFVASRK